MFSSQSLTVTFAGQAGFILEDAAGYRVGIDLYLSNCCERYFGFKRLMPYLYNPQELQLDLLVATHAHYDHFDPDSVPLLMGDGKTQLVCARDVREEAERLHLDGSKITYLGHGEQFENGSICIRALACDHGELAPDALGLLITFGGKTIYITGDTAYREDIFSDPAVHGVDLLILPINGAFGNLNEAQAAAAAGMVRPALTVPCHYWNFAEHGGNPDLFAKAMQTTQSEVPYLLMRPGESISL